MKTFEFQVSFSVSGSHDLRINADSEAEAFAELKSKYLIPDYVEIEDEFDAMDADEGLINLSMSDSLYCEIVSVVEVPASNQGDA